MSSKHSNFVRNGHFTRDSKEFEIVHIIREGTTLLFCSFRALYIAREKGKEQTSLNIYIYIYFEVDRIVLYIHIL